MHTISKDIVLYIKKKKNKQTIIIIIVIIIIIRIMYFLWVIFDYTSL